MLDAHLDGMFHLFDTLLQFLSDLAVGLWCMDGLDVVVVALPDLLSFFHGLFALLFNFLLFPLKLFNLLIVAGLGNLERRVFFRSLLLAFVVHLVNEGVDLVCKVLDLSPDNWISSCPVRKDHVHTGSQLPLFGAE